METLAVDAAVAAAAAAAAVPGLGTQTGVG